jgi:glycosyltransferase involved in cell wall biosynthesis
MSGARRKLGLVRLPGAYWRPPQQLDPPLRVLLHAHIYPSDKYPSYGVFIAKQAQLLRENHGVDVLEVVSPENPASRWDKLIKFTRLAVRSVRARFARVDLVHLHYASPAHLLASTPNTLLRSTPCVITLHGSDITTLAPSGWTNRLVSFYLQRSTRVIAVSHDMARLAQERCGVRAENILVANMGTEIAHFEPRLPGNKSAAKTSLGLDPDHLLVLYVGHLLPHKGLDILLDAFARVSADRPVQLAMIGPGDPEELADHRKRVSDSERVFWPGEMPQHELVAWYQAADVFVLPSRREAFGLVLVEAMASGTPVIGSRVGGIPEVIGENGLMFDSENSRELAERLRDLLGDEANRLRLATAALEVVEQFSADSQTAKVAELCRELTS